jgi:hypothetical protein
MSTSLIVKICFYVTLLACLIACSDNKDIDSKAQIVDTTESYSDNPKESYKLSDVDFISLQPAVYNNTLRVQVNYINKEDDSTILWSGEDVSCFYTIFKTDYLGSSKRIEEVLNGEKILKRADQAFYIDTDQFETGNYYLITSLINTGFIKIESSGSFFYSKND